MRPMGFQQKTGNEPTGINSTFGTMQQRDTRVGSFLRSVYGWMFLGLGITAVTAFIISSSPAIIETIIVNRGLLWVVLLGQLGLVLFLSLKVNSLAPATAAVLFIVYSALTGV